MRIVSQMSECWCPFAITATRDTTAVTSLNIDSLKKNNLREGIGLVITLKFNGDPKYCLLPTAAFDSIKHFQKTFNFEII